MISKKFLKEKNKNIGEQMMQFLTKLFPYNRSITGKGTKKTLIEIKNVTADLKIKKVKTGERFYNWTIPKEWNVKNAFILNPENKKIVDFKNNNLHLVGYSQPIKKEMTLKDLKKKLHYIQNKPNALPYVTTYYKKDWGFSITYNEYKKLKNGTYEVNIDSSFKDGYLNYGEIYLKGKVKKEILISTYICHPSMANNELSGPTVAVFLFKWLKKIKNRKYSYRFVFIPETIGSIVFINKNFKVLKKNLLCGFVLSCLGDNNNYSLIHSPYKNSIADKIVKKIIYKKKNAKVYSFLQRGSDERQYCSPFVDLPVVGISRSKYHTYPEYHTSDDNLEFVNADGLYGGLKFIKEIIIELENMNLPKTNNICEPFLSQFENTKFKKLINNHKQRIEILNVLAYCNGTNSEDEISKLVKMKLVKVQKILNVLESMRLISL